MIYLVDKKNKKEIVYPSYKDLINSKRVLCNELGRTLCEFLNFDFQKLYNYIISEAEKGESVFSTLYKSTEYQSLSPVAKLIIDNDSNLRHLSVRIKKNKAANFEICTISNVFDNSIKIIELLQENISNNIDFDYDFLEFSLSSFIRHDTIEQKNILTSKYITPYFFIMSIINHYFRHEIKNKSNEEIENSIRTISSILINSQSPKLKNVIMYLPKESVYYDIIVRIIAYYKKLNLNNLNDILDMKINLYYTPNYIYLDNAINALNDYPKEKILCLQAIFEFSKDNRYSDFYNIRNINEFLYSSILESCKIGYAIKKCPICGKYFIKKNAENARTFCSKECASINTIHRREKRYELFINDDFTLNGDKVVNSIYKSLFYLDGKAIVKEFTFEDTVKLSIKYNNTTDNRNMDLIITTLLEVLYIRIKNDNKMIKEEILAINDSREYIKKYQCWLKENKGEFCFRNIISRIKESNLYISTLKDDFYINFSFINNKNFSLQSIKIIIKVNQEGEYYTKKDLTSSLDDKFYSRLKNTVFDEIKNIQNDTIIIDIDSIIKIKSSVAKKSVNKNY